MRIATLVVCAVLYSRILDPALIRSSEQPERALLRGRLWIWSDKPEYRKKPGATWPSPMPRDLA